MEWNMNLIREAVTLISLVAFLGIVAWAWSRAQAARFEEASRLPFADQD